MNDLRQQHFIMRLQSHDTQLHFVPETDSTLRHWLKRNAVESYKYRVALIFFLITGTIGLFLFFYMM